MTIAGTDITPRKPSQAGQFLDWWVAQLAAPDASSARKRKPWRAMILARASTGAEPATAGPSYEVHVRKGEGRGSEIVGHFDAATLTAALPSIAKTLNSQAVTSDLLVLRLPPSQVIERRLTLPSGVRDVLRPVLANKIETMAPWPASQALYAYQEVAGAAAPGGQIAVDVWVTSRARVEKLLDDLARFGLKPGTVDVGLDAEAPVAINLISSSHDDTLARRAKVKRGLVTAAVTAGLVSAACVAWMLYQQRELAGIEGRVQAALKAASSAANPGSDVRRRANAAALALRHDQAAVAIMLEALSRALPDDAALDRLEMRNGAITMTGKATDVPGLIALLEASPHFEAVEFAAPTTREEGSSRSIFSITAKVKPHMTMEIR